MSIALLTNNNGGREFLSNANNVQNNSKHGVINGTGKKSSNSSLLNSLNEQKKILTDIKKEIMDKCLKDGGDMSAHKDELKDIDKQLANINDEISQAQADEVKETSNANKKNKKKGNSVESNSNDSEIQNLSESMRNVLSLSGGLAQTKNLISQKKLMTGNENALKIEIKADASRGVNSDYKDKKVNKIESGIRNIDNNIGTNLGNITRKIHDGEKNKSKICKNIKKYNDNVDNKIKGYGEKISVIA